jgi:C1A family cysteine protease
MSKKLHWVPDLPDFRDHLYAPLDIAVPAVVDLRHYCSTVEDQGDLGSCTGNAIVGAMELLENKAGTGFTDLSRLFVYYQERKIEGTVRQDSGAYIRDGIKAVNQIGVSTEKLWPYDISKFKRKPIKAAYTDAANRKLAEYLRVTSFADLKNALAAGFPVVFGFTVYSSFMTQTVAASGNMPMPARGDQVEGGHAVLCVGYDDTRKVAIVRNSWGAGWGDKGYFYMPYDYISNANLCDDFWACKK